MGSATWKCNCSISNLTAGNSSPSVCVVFSILWSVYVPAVVEVMIFCLVFSSSRCFDSLLPFYCLLSLCLVSVFVGVCVCVCVVSLRCGARCFTIFPWLRQSVKSVSLRCFLLNFWCGSGSRCFMICLDLCFPFCLNLSLECASAEKHNT